MYEITRSSSNVFTDEDLEGYPRLRRGDFTYLQTLMMMEALASESFGDFMNIQRHQLQIEISHEDYHEFHLNLRKVFDDNQHITTRNFEDVEEPDLVDDDPDTPLPRTDDPPPSDPRFKHSVEHLSRENKHIILETDEESLVEMTIKWLNMYNDTMKKKIMKRVVGEETKEEEMEEVEEEAEEDDTKEPFVPAPTKEDIECQADEPSMDDDQAGSSYTKEEPVPSEDSCVKETSEEKKDDIQHDDTAPEPTEAKRTYYGQDITGNEDDSIFRKLKDCFTGDQYDEWTGFYGKGYPASTPHRHMFWHVKYRKTMKPHENHQFTNTDDQLMAEYIARHKDQDPSDELQELKNTIEYSCSDPRLHPLQVGFSIKHTNEAEARIDDDFQTLSSVLENYVEDHSVLPYCVLLRCMAARYLGGSLIDPEHAEKEFPYRSSLQFSVMFWNLGNWCRSRFDKCPVPDGLQRLVPHINYDMDEDHNPIGQGQNTVQQLFHQRDQILRRPSFLEL